MPRIDLADLPLRRTLPFMRVPGPQERAASRVGVVGIPFDCGAHPIRVGARLGPAVADTVAGQIQCAISTMPAAVPNIQAGRLRGLGIAGKKRSAAIPDVPTMAEAGVKGVEGENWNGVLAPTGVPPAILAVLNREIVKAVNQPQTRERFATFSLEAISSIPEEFRKVIDFELKRWAEVVKAANIQAE